MGSNYWHASSFTSCGSESNRRLMCWNRRRPEQQPPSVSVPLSVVLPMDAKQSQEKAIALSLRALRFLGFCKAKRTARAPHLGVLGFANFGTHPDAFRVTTETRCTSPKPRLAKRTAYETLLQGFLHHTLYTHWVLTPFRHMSG